MKEKPLFLFFHEGATKKEFYSQIFSLKFAGKGLRILMKDLKGGSNLNKKVVEEVDSILSLRKFQAETNIHIIVAFDREGRRSTPIRLNSKLIIKETRSWTKKVKTLNPIVATQDLESWFFYDLEGIFKYLGISPSKSNLKKYNNPESFNNKDLSKLFLSKGKLYQKGKKVTNFINSLDLEKIFKSCADLREGVEKMIELSEKNT